MYIKILPCLLPFSFFLLSPSLLHSHLLSILPTFLSRQQAKLWLTPQKYTMAWDTAGQTRELRIQSKFPTEVARTQRLEWNHHPSRDSKDQKSRTGKKVRI